MKDVTDCEKLVVVFPTKQDRKSHTKRKVRAAGGKLGRLYRMCLPLVWPWKKGNLFLLQVLEVR